MWNIPPFEIMPLARLILDFVPIEQRRHWIQTANAKERQQLLRLIIDERIWNQETVLALARSDDVSSLLQKPNWMSFILYWPSFFECTGPECMKLYASRITPKTAYAHLRNAMDTITERNFAIAFATIALSDDDRRRLFVNVVKSLSVDASRRQWIVAGVQTYLPCRVRIKTFELAVKIPDTDVIDCIANGIDNATLCSHFKTLCFAKATQTLLEIKDSMQIENEQLVSGYYYAAMRHADVLTTVARVAPLRANCVDELWKRISKDVVTTFSTEAWIVILSLGYFPRCQLWTHLATNPVLQSQVFATIDFDVDL